VGTRRRKKNLLTMQENTAAIKHEKQQFGMRSENKAYGLLCKELILRNDLVYNKLLEGNTIEMRTCYFNFLN
jgi:hypothetical protein